MTKLFENILVPYDFSPAATAALRVASGLAARSHGTLLVVHVMSPIYPPHGAPLRPPASSVALVVRALEDVVARTVRNRRIRKARTRVVVGQPVASIVAAAAAVDSIVMGTRGRGGLAHLLLGSVAERVVRSAPVPVLTIGVSKRGAPVRR